jgi:hypothetical protein
LINRTTALKKTVKVKVVDTENLEEKDKFLYTKYRSSLSQSKTLIDQLDENHEKLNKSYKQAKKGKKHRSILNASLGATTGLAPVAMPNDPQAYKAGIGNWGYIGAYAWHAGSYRGNWQIEIGYYREAEDQCRNQKSATTGSR